MSELVLTGEERARADARLATLLDRHERGLQQARLLPTLDRDRLAERLTVCFALHNGSPDGHATLLDTLAADNTALLGPVVVNGRHGIRACITNHRTTPADIDLILDRLHTITTTPPTAGTRTNIG